VSCSIPAQRQQQQECVNEALTEQTRGIRDCTLEENGMAKAACFAEVSVAFCLSMKDCQTKCECPSGTAECNGECVDVSTNANCGACGNACTSDQTCQRTAPSGTIGQYVCMCPSGSSPCNGQCKAMNTDTNCGGTTSSCGQDCTVAGTGKTCQNGACQCPEGKEFFTGLNKCVPKCTGDLQRDPNTGACVCPVLPGGVSTQCGDKCVDTNTDTNNCGSCGHACPSDQTCSGGTCQSQCPTGTTKDEYGNCKCTDPNLQFCNGQCMDPATFNTLNHCGSCDADCSKDIGFTGTAKTVCVNDPRNNPQYYCDYCPLGQHFAGNGDTCPFKCIPDGCNIFPENNCALSC